MTTRQTPEEILLRLSLVAGFTARHLDALRRGWGSSVAPGPAGEARRSILRKGLEAATSKEAGDLAERTAEACARAGTRIIPLGSAGYPALLAAVPDAPLVLYRRGAAAESGQAVALVGSRAPTGPAMQFGRELAAELAGAGLTVVSGMARGIDTAAHEGALKGGGTTIAVLGCGVDVLYPPEAGRLRDRILEQGAVVSEFPPGTPPLARHFPLRNRLISGMSQGVVVVEAPVRSGALITAGIALDQGREVMAVPGSPLFPHTAGSNGLLREGATPVTGAEDVLLALGWSFGRLPGNALVPQGEEQRILEFAATERHVNEISCALGIPVQGLLPLLLEMEFRKLLERREGDYYKKTSAAGRVPPGS